MTTENPTTAPDSTAERRPFTVLAADNYVALEVPSTLLLLDYDEAITLAARIVGAASEVGR